MKIQALRLAALLVGGASASAQFTVGPQTQVDAGRGVQPCNETTASASPVNPLEIVAGWNDYREGVRCGIGLSLDGGESWSDFVLRPPGPNQANVEGDPMTCADPRTGTLWAGGIAFSGNGGIYIARKDPGSATFEPTVMMQTAGGVDKGWLAAGPDPSNPTGATRVYCAYNFGVVRSADMGDTWQGPVSLGPGLAFLPRVGPDGMLYVGYWDFNNKVLLRRSSNGGVSFGPVIEIATRMDVWGVDSSRTPGNFRSPPLLGLAVSPDGNSLYCVYPDTTSIESNGFNVDTYFTKSTDQGLTWSTPVILNTDAALPGDQFFPWIETDQQGDLHVVFFDTRGTNQTDTGNVGLVDTYYAFSSDDGASWVEEKLTADPLDSNLAFPGGIFIGDYLGMSVAGNRVLPMYVDTDNGDADVFTRLIVHGPATDFCMGVECPCGNDTLSGGCGNSGDDGSIATGGVLSASGTASAAADDVELTISGMAPGQFGLVYTGGTAATLPFGNGLRCIGGTVFRYPVRPADASGVLSYGPGEVVALSGNFGAGGQVMPGDRRLYQGWYRDPGGPCGSSFNLTNGLMIDWQ